MGIDAQMLIRSKRQRTEAEVLELAYRMSAALGTDLFIIDRDGWGGRKPHHCLTICNEFMQDGDSIVPRPGEQLIEVHLSGRYYGVGYERGPLADYIAIAEFIEEIAPDAEVMYGGDSSGVCAESFGRSERKLLWKHFCEVGHAPYTRAFDRIEIGDGRPVCTLCNKPYLQYGWGKDYAAYFCPGCGHKQTYRAGKLEEEAGSE
jgi:predicted RNA-binding Zn-ribbon protein involved in translation (DUF1610 family)